MSQNLTLRQAAKKIYEENSLRVSTCYELENLQEINVIFIPGDAPAYVKEVASQLERHVRLKYSRLLIRNAFNTGNVRFIRKKRSLR